MKYVFTRTLLSIFIAIFLAGCGSGSSPSPALAQTDAPVTFIPDSPQVERGWLDQYSTHIEDKVSGTFPGLLGIPSSRMITVCPKWETLTRGEREKFWSALLYSIAGPESGRTRTSIYRESTMGIDAVTGQQIRSEGLLQLSYVDVVNYHYPDGDVSWSNDRVMALADYAAGVSRGNPARTLLNAYANLNLGLFIMNQLVELHPAEALETAFGRYWSTMRVTKATFSEVMTALRGRITDCF